MNSLSLLFQAGDRAETIRVRLTHSRTALWIWAVGPIGTPKSSGHETRQASPSEWSVAAPTSEYLASVNELVDNLNQYEAQYGEMLQQLAAAHSTGDIEKVARIESAMGHVSFMFHAVAARIGLLSATQGVWPTLLAERAESHGRQLGRATWVLAAATLGLVVATIALIVVTALKA